MQITKEEIRQTAALARLTLSPAQAETLAAELGQLLTYMEQLGELDGPETEAPALSNVWREDTLYPALPRESLLEQAPRQDKGCILVPQILE